MAVTFRAAATMAGASAAAFTCNKPTGTVDNDFMIAEFLTEPSKTVSAPAGWSLLESTQVASSPNVKHLVYYKKAASEGASYTWTWTGSVATIGGIITVTGQSPTFAFGAKGTNWNSARYANQATPTTSGCTPDAADNLLIIIGSEAFGAGTTWGSYAVSTSNPTWTEAWDINTTATSPDVSAYCAYGSRAVATATGDASATSSVGEEDCIFILAISPAAAGPANVKTEDGLAFASTKTVMGLAVASIKTIDGLA